MYFLSVDINFIARTYLEELHCRFNKKSDTMQWTGLIIKLKKKSKLQSEIRKICSQSEARNKTTSKLDSLKADMPLTKLNSKQNNDSNIAMKSTQFAGGNLGAVPTKEKYILSKFQFLMLKL